MSVIRDNFLHIVGREPTAKEVSHISGIIKANNIREDDAFLAVVVIDYAHNVANEEAIKNGNGVIKSTLEDGYKHYLIAIDKAKRTAEDTARQSIESVAYEVVKELKEESVKVIASTAKESIQANSQWSLFWVITGLIIVYSIGMFNGYVFSLHQLPAWLNKDSKATEILTMIINAPALAIVLLYAAFVMLKQSFDFTHDVAKVNWLTMSVSFLSFIAGLFLIVAAH